MRHLSGSDMAQLIERFLDGRSLYPQEWNDFVDTSQRDQKMDVYRRRCYELDFASNQFHKTGQGTQKCERLHRIAAVSCDECRQILFGFSVGCFGDEKRH